MSDFIVSTKMIIAINKYAKGREKVFSKTQSTDTSESGLKSKLFIQRTPSDETTYQIRQESQRRYDTVNQMPKYTSKQRIFFTKKTCKKIHFIF